LKTYKENYNAVDNVMTFITDGISSIKTLNKKDRIAFLSILISYIPI
jgi:hypothetical protein